ncbi:MAG: hypothetical protein ABIJ96_02595, partial [Elusimicrobiota bacterium]
MELNSPKPAGWKKHLTAKKLISGAVAFVVVAGITVAVLQEDPDALNKEAEMFSLNSGQGDFRRAPRPPALPKLKESKTASGLSLIRKITGLLDKKEEPEKIAAADMKSAVGEQAAADAVDPNAMVEKMLGGKGEGKGSLSVKESMGGKSGGTSKGSFGGGGAGGLDDGAGMQGSGSVPMPSRDKPKGFVAEFKKRLRTAVARLTGKDQMISQGSKTETGFDSGRAANASIGKVTSTPFGTGSARPEISVSQVFGGHEASGGATAGGSGGGAMGGSSGSGGSGGIGDLAPPPEVGEGECADGSLGCIPSNEKEA